MWVYSQFSKSLQKQFIRNLLLVKLQTVGKNESGRVNYNVIFNNNFLMSK